MKKNSKNGFTLVELLAVIVILAIILVIAVPKVMSVIEDAKKATLESTAKMIASQAEKQKVQNTVLGKTDTITCDSVAKINDADYEDCDIDFDENTAKVTIEGSGKFEGLFVCDGTKTSATAQEESCTPVINATNFVDDDWATIVAAVKQAETNGTEYPYNVGDEKTVDMGSLGVHTIRVANTIKCADLQTKVLSQTACGFVLEFADIITEHEMNGDPDNNTGQTSYGGWPASELREYVNETIYNALPEELRNGIINTYVVSSYGLHKTTGAVENENAGVLESELYWSNDKLYLLSPQEVYGTSFAHAYDKSNGTSRQLDYYATYKDDGYTGEMTAKFVVAIKNYGSGNAVMWWLRSADYYYGGRFYYVGGYGNWSCIGSLAVNGVAPAFRLAN